MTIPDTGRQTRNYVQRVMENLQGVIRVSVVATGVDINSVDNARPAVSPRAPALPQRRAA